MKNITKENTQQQSNLILSQFILIQLRMMLTKEQFEHLENVNTIKKLLKVGTEEVLNLKFGDISDGHVTIRRKKTSSNISGALPPEYYGIELFNTLMEIAKFEDHIFNPRRYLKALGLID